MRLDQRRLRYGSPIALVVLGVAWAALDTDRLGNTAGTALIAVGLIALMVVLGRDLGMSERSGRARRVPPPAPPAPTTPERRQPEPSSQRGGSTPGSPS